MSKREDPRRGRTKKPVFLDEPIQWHLGNSKYDECPVCGSDDVGYLGRRERTCMSGCGMSTTLGGSPKDWFQQKMEHYPIEALKFPIDGIVQNLTPNDHRVAEAQELSIDGRAWLPTNTMFGVITWKKGDPFPMEAAGQIGKKKRKPRPYALPGSTLWYALRLHPVWTPHQPKTALDLIVDAVGPELVVAV